MPKRPHSVILETLSAAAAEERGLPARLGRQFRKMQREAYDPDTHTVTLAISSEAPVERSFGTEILSHAPGAIRTGRLDQGMPLLFNHDPDKHLGVTTGYKLGSDGVLRTTNQFGDNPLALEKEGDVRTKILKDVSLAYVIHKADVEEDDRGNRTVTATDWEPLENSLVTIPADSSVGVGRSARDDDNPIVYTVRSAAASKSSVKSSVKSSADDADLEDEDDEDLEDEPDLDDDERSLTPPAAVPPPSPTTQPAPTRTAPMPEPITPAVTDVVDVAAQNQARVTELRSLNAKYPKFFDARALKAAEDLGSSAERAKERIFEAVMIDAQRSDIPTVGDEVLGGMTDKDLSRYSLAGAYRAAANQRTPNTFRGSKLEGGLELAVSEELVKTAGERGVTSLGGGVAIPSATALAAARAQRTIASGGNAGSATNFTVVSTDPIELLRNRLVLAAMGAQVISGLHGAMQMTKQTAAGTSNWVLEGGTATETDPQFGYFTMKPNRLTMQNAYFRDFLAQSGLAIDSTLANDRMAVLARALDTAGLAGSGVAPVPLGLLNQTGLAAVLSGSSRSSTGAYTAGAGGVPMTYVDFNNLEAGIATANADIGTLGIITTPKVRAAARSTPKTPGTATDYIWPDSKMDGSGVQEGPLGMRAICTSNSVLTGFTANAVNNLHAVIMGVFDQIIIGDWGLSELIPDPYSGAAQARMLFTENAYYDINVRHIEAFAACTSALPS